MADLYDEMSHLVFAMAGITGKLLAIETVPPPSGDVAARLHYVLDVMVAYREGVEELHKMLSTHMDRLLDS